MKKYLVLLAALFVSSHAFAVTVENCPTNLSLSVSEFKIISAKALEKKLSVAENEDGYVERARKRLQEMKTISVEMPRFQAAKARCIYKAEEFLGTFYTSKGRDLLRVTHTTRKYEGDEMETFEYSVYLDVESYSDKGFKVAKTEKAGLAFEKDAGQVRSPLFLGNAAKVTLKTLKVNSLICTLANKKTSIAAGVLLVNDNVFAYANDFDVGKYSYGFVLEHSPDFENSAVITFQENNLVQDEVGQTTCEYDLKKDIGKKICVEPIENDGKVIGEFSCQLQ